MSGIVVYLAGVFAAAFWIKPKFGPEIYGTYKDMVPVLIAVAAAVLTGCVQRRISFLTEVRKLYDQSIKAFEDALQYTHLKKTDQPQFAAVYNELACTIELFRGSFRNAGDSQGRRGLFPFEALKAITDWHSYLHFGPTYKRWERQRARDAMVILWQEHFRPPLLGELDRHRPWSFSSPYWRRGV
jgi:hypothetical protein